MVRAFLAGLGVAVAALFVLLFVSVPGWTANLHPDCNVTMPCTTMAGQVVQVQRKSAGYAGAPGSKREQARLARGRDLERRLPIGAALGRGETPSGFIRGRLVCARNVNAALAARGIPGTGSALAKSFLSWGRGSSVPVKDAVAVFSRGRRGGHVAIVHEVKSDGTVIYLNPSSRRQAWQVGPYNRRPIAFRVAG